MLEYYLENNYLTLRSKSHEGHYSTRHTGFSFLFGKACPDHNFFVFPDSSLYLVCGCMTIRRYVTYCIDLCGTLTSRSTKEEKIKLKQYVSFRSKGRNNNGNMPRLKINVFTAVWESSVSCKFFIAPLHLYISSFEFMRLLIPDNGY
jgi:hypothetical protein